MLARLHYKLLDVLATQPRAVLLNGDGGGALRTTNAPNSERLIRAHRAVVVTNFHVHATIAF